MRYFVSKAGESQTCTGTHLFQRSQARKNNRIKIKDSGLSAVIPAPAHVLLYRSLCTGEAAIVRIQQNQKAAHLDRHTAANMLNGQPE